MRGAKAAVAAAAKIEAVKTASVAIAGRAAKPAGIAAACRAAEALASTVPEALPLSDRWDDLCTLALVLGQRR